MKSKFSVTRIIAVIMLVVMMATLLVSLTGCNKKESAIEFGETEAVRYKDLPIDVNDFILYAADILPSFVELYGADVFDTESVDLGWVTADPISAAILYVTDIMTTTKAMVIYYDEAIGELSEDEQAACKEQAEAVYAMVQGKLPDETGLTEALLYQYQTEMYKLSYVYDDLCKTYADDAESLQAAVFGIKNACDPTFDYSKNVNWDVVEQIDFTDTDIYLPVNEE